jgi:hypothetical protein
MRLRIGFSLNAQLGIFERPLIVRELILFRQNAALPKPCKESGIVRNVIRLLANV